MGAVYLPSQYGMILVPLANVQVKPGDKLRITCRYSHVGQAENQTLYAAIGNSGWAGFDEVLHGSKTISVPEDSAWDYHEEYVDISMIDSAGGIFFKRASRSFSDSPARYSIIINSVLNRCSIS